MAHPDARDRTLVALAVQRGVLSPSKVSRVLALCDRLNQPAEDVLPRWVEDGPDLVTQGKGYRYRCGCRLRTLDELAAEAELRCSQCRRPFVAEVSPDPLEESSVRGRPVPEQLEETLRQPKRFAPRVNAPQAPATPPGEPTPQPTPPEQPSPPGRPTSRRQPTSSGPKHQPGFASTRRDPYRGDRESPLPERIGPFEVEHQLGTGATGAVYLAKHPRGRPVAVKLLHGSVDAEALLRFQREVHIGRELRHPGIVEVLDTGQTDDGQHYLVMDYVPGLTLRTKLDQGPLDPPEALQIVRQAAEAVAFLHEQGLIHRDLKPENLILDPARGRVRITDLGLARPVKDLSITDTGTVVGTPHYMSPEQLAGDKELDATTDVYALGVILFECLTGSTLHPDLTALALAAAIFDEPPPVPQRAGVELPAPLVKECLRALDPDPAQRHATAAELAYKLACLGSLAPSAGARWRPHPALALGVALILLAVAILLWPSGAEAPPIASPTPAPSASPSPTPLATRTPPPSPPPPDETVLRAERCVPEWLDPDPNRRRRADPPAMWDEAVETHPLDARPLYARATCWIVAGDYLMAYEDMARARRLGPPPPRILLDVTLPVFFVLGFERAAIDWQRQREPDPLGQLLLGALLVQARPPIQDTAGAREVLRAIVGLPRASEDSRGLLLAMTALMDGNPEQGERELLGVSPKAQVLFRQWRDRERPPYLPLLLGVEVGLLPKVLEALRVGELGPARLLDEFLPRLDDSGERVALLNYAAYTYALEGGWLQAIELAQRALEELEQLPQHPALIARCRLTRAQALLLGQRHGEAIQELERALHVQPDPLSSGERCDGLRLLALAHILRDEREAAERALRLAEQTGAVDQRELEAVREQLQRKR